MFLSCTTADPADLGAVFDLENSSWLLRDGKLCVILFIAGDLVCLSLRCETDTETGFLVAVLAGKPLKAKGSGDIISFELKLIFCSCSMISLSVFFLNSYRKNLSIFFCTFDKVPTFSLCPCFRLKSLFSVDIDNFSNGTKWLFSER